MSRSERFKQQLAELVTKRAIRQAQITANPKPYIEEMGKLCDELRIALAEAERVIERAQLALAVRSDFYFQTDESINNTVSIPESIREDAYSRFSKALEILREYERLT